MEVGLYSKVQIELVFNYNPMEASQFPHDQIRYIQGNKFLVIAICQHKIGLNGI